MPEGPGVGQFLLCRWEKALVKCFSLENTLCYRQPSGHISEWLLSPSFCQRQEGILCYCFSWPWEFGGVPGGEIRECVGAPGVPVFHTSPPALLQNGHLMFLQVYSSSSFFPRGASLGCNLCIHLSLQISGWQFVQQLRKVIGFQFIYLFLVVRMGITVSKLFMCQVWNCNPLESKLVIPKKIKVSIPLTSSFHIKTPMCSQNSYIRIFSKILCINIEKS